MNFKTIFDVIYESEHSPGLKKISLQEAIDRNMFGPVYHGTTQDSMSLIKSDGFKIIKTEKEGKKHGYSDDEYYAGTPAPIHHLGFGVYFTTVKAIAKRISGDSPKNLHVFYIDVSSGKGMETINFGSQKNMMNWWIKNGYSPALARSDRYRATEIMTDTIKESWDAVWFKGKGGFYKLLDGDQLCVYDTSKIYMIDESLSDGKLEIGSRIRRKSDGAIGIVYEIVKRTGAERSVYNDLSDEEWEDRKQRLYNFFGKEVADKKLAEQKEFFKKAAIVKDIEGDNFQTYRIKWNKGGKKLKEYFSIEIEPYRSRQ